MSDKEILEWIWQRLVKEYGEAPNCDYMIRLAKIIEKMESLQKRRT